MTQPADVSLRSTGDTDAETVWRWSLGRRRQIAFRAAGSEIAMARPRPPPIKLQGDHVHGQAKAEGLPKARTIL